MPGPTLYQMVITIATLKLQSPLAGFVAFLLYNIPSWIMLFILGTLANMYVDHYYSTQMKLAFLGFNAAAAGVMVRSMLIYFNENNSKISTLLIMIGSAVIFAIFRSSGSIVFCLITGAIYSLYISIESKSEMSSRSQNLFRNIKHSWIMGKISIYIFIGLYLALWILSAFYPNSIF